ncbi:hypothetical protein GCM10010844_41000 [Deinococcus radiotolerans]|uniref:Uncharacterized protein n=1 Tax=Deinococcus radiotolerans TaxID=1309407 RepID=A0ABQ2FQZ2_9DEIO|nr:hypothetical protein GCM10010844_41000 [Deinococcus radiotolerans]
MFILRGVETTTVTGVRVTGNVTVEGASRVGLAGARSGQHADGNTIVMRGATVHFKGWTEVGAWGSQDSSEELEIHDPAVTLRRSLAYPVTQPPLCT